MMSEGTVFQTDQEIRRAQLGNKIQIAIQKEAEMYGEKAFYSPSGGQLWSHVAYRIRQAVMRALDDA